MTKIDFKYNIKDNIKIKSINMLGLVVGYFYGESGIQYQVAYFADNERKTSYVYPEEIDKLDAKEMSGFLK
jgi:hypothetical protein